MISEGISASLESRKVSFSSAEKEIPSARRMCASGFMPAGSISQTAVYVAASALGRNSLEVQEDINCRFGGIGLQPMANGFVVQRQFAENLFLVGLQFAENFLIFYLVENVVRSDRPGGVKLSFGSGRKPRQHHFAEVVLGALLNAHGIRDSVRLIVIRRDRIDFCLEVTMAPVLFANAIPARFHLHSVGDFPRFYPQQTDQRELRHERVPGPTDFFPAINRARDNRHVYGNLFGQLLIGIAGQQHFRWTERYAQVSLLEINGFYRFGEEQVDRHSRVGFTQDLREMLLNSFGR